MFRRNYKWSGFLLSFILETEFWDRNVEKKNKAVRIGKVFSVLWALVNGMDPFFTICISNRLLRDCNGLPVKENDHEGFGRQGFGRIFLQLRTVFSAPYRFCFFYWYQLFYYFSTYFYVFYRFYYIISHTSSIMNSLGSFWKAEIVLWIWITTCGIKFGNRG